MLYDSTSGLGLLIGALGKGARYAPPLHPPGPAIRIEFLPREHDLREMGHRQDDDDGASMTDREKRHPSNQRGRFFALGEDGRTPFDVGDEASFQYWWANGYGYDHIAETRFGNYIVSTIFFGHAVHGPDQLFETMIYEDEDHLVVSERKPELAVWRCATWDDAERQHQHACDWLREQIKALNAWG